MCVCDTIDEWDSVCDRFEAAMRERFQFKLNQYTAEERFEKIPKQIEIENYIFEKLE